MIIKFAIAAVIFIVSLILITGGHKVNREGEWEVYRDSVQASIYNDVLAREVTKHLVFSQDTIPQ